MLAALARRLWLPIVIFIAAVALAVMYHPFALPEGGDNAIWDYVAQCILRGQVPYRDVIEIKTPAAAYLSALGMAVGRWFGADTVLAVRLLFVLLVGALCVTVYLVGEAYLRNRLAALLACLLPLLAPNLMVMMISGTRPKVPMFICGMLTLWFISKDRPFRAGFCSMLAFLFWQPGLMFTATALLIFSGYMTRWRDRRALRVLLGASIPLAVMLIYFAMNGALGDLWAWTITYNYAVYYPEGHERPGVALNRLWFLIQQVMDGQTLWVKLGLLGLLGFAAERIIRRVRKSPPADDLFKEALLAPPLVFLAFCLMNYPGADGLIVLLPMAGLFAAFVFAAMYEWLAARRFIESRPALARLVPLVLIAPLAVVAFTAIKRAGAFQIEEGRQLADQRREFQKIAERLGPNDRIYVHGSLEILVLLDRPNMNPYIFLDRGKDGFLAARRAGGLDALLAEMKSAAPQVVALGRLQNVACRDALIDWAESQYELLPLSFAHNSVYVAKTPEAPAAGQK
jgi:DolP-mannose mannosyltransferase